jgi:hypothetical protein
LSYTIDKENNGIKIGKGEHLMKRLVLCLVILFTVAVSYANAGFISNFSWVPDTSVTTDSETLEPGQDLTLTVSGIYYNKSGTRAFLGLGDILNPTIMLNFTQPINNLRLLIQDIDKEGAGSAWENLSGFNILPTSVDGNYELTGGIVTSTLYGDEAKGNLFWSSLPTNTTSIYFNFNRQIIGCGIYLNEIEETTPIPEPSTILLLSTGLGGILAFAIRKKLKI